MAPHNRPKKQTINLYNVLLLCFVGFGSISAGYSGSIIGTTLGQPSFYEYFNLLERSDTNALISAMNGIFQAGGVIGVLSLPYVLDTWGRKWAIATAAIVNLVASALLAGSTHIAMFLVFRFFTGASCNMILAAIPLWMAEVVPARLRASLVDIHSVFFIIGYFIQGWVGYGFYFWSGGGTQAWRLPLALACPWPFFLLCGIYWVPESPRWLMLKDRGEDAKATLYALHADHTDPDNGLARMEYYQIQKQIAIDRTLGNSWMHLFTKPSYRKRAVLAVATTGIVQFSGVLVINNYGPSLYKNLGFSPVKQLLYPAAWLSLTLGTNIIGMITVDWFPRNYFLGAGIIGCQITLMVEAALVANFVPSDNESALKAAVAMLFVFQIAYGVCMDGTQFSYLNELFPTHLRAKGVCLGVSMIALMNVMWLSVAPTAFEKIGWKFYLCFIIPGCLGGICMILFFPNTKGKPLEEIAALFGDEDEVAVYERDLVMDQSKHVLIDHAHGDVVADKPKGVGKQGEVDAQKVVVQEA